MVFVTLNLGQSRYYNESCCCCCSVHSEWYHEFNRLFLHVPCCYTVALLAVAYCLILHRLSHPLRQGLLLLFFRTIVEHNRRWLLAYNVRNGRRLFSATAATVSSFNATVVCGASVAAGAGGAYVGMVYVTAGICYKGMRAGAGGGAGTTAGRKH